MTVTIDGTAVINSVLLTEQGSAPTTPSAGLEKLYVTTNGLYLLKSSGSVIGPFITGTASGLSIGRVLINEASPTGTTVTWGGIPATYNSLEIEYVARGTQGANNVLMYMYFNNDSTATNYRRTNVFGYANNLVATDTGDDALISSVSAASATAGNAVAGLIRIINYASTIFNKQSTCLYSLRIDASGTGVITTMLGHTWESTTAINRIDLVLSAGNFVDGSKIRLYGVY